MTEERTPTTLPPLPMGPTRPAVQEAITATPQEPSWSRRRRTSPRHRWTEEGGFRLAGLRQSHEGVAPEPGRRESSAGRLGDWWGVCSQVLSPADQASDWSQVPRSSGDLLPPARHRLAEVRQVGPAGRPRGSASDGGPPVGHRRRILESCEASRDSATRDRDCGQHEPDPTGPEVCKGFRSCGRLDPNKTMGATPLRQGWQRLAPPPGKDDN